MVGIPKMFLTDGVKMTETAKAAIDSVKRAVKTEVFSESKLLGHPSSDLFERASYMREASFWEQPQNLANYARGEFLATRGPKWAKKAAEGEIKVIEDSPEMYKSYMRQAGNKIEYHEFNRITGKRQCVILDINGMPQTHIKDSKLTSLGEHGKPLEIYDANYRTTTMLAEDGITPTSVFGKNECQQVFFGADGKTPVKRITYTDSAQYGLGIKIGNKKIGAPQVKSIRFYGPDGKTTKIVYKNPETGEITKIKEFGKEKYAITEFDADGNVLKQYFEPRQSK